MPDSTLPRMFWNRVEKSSAQPAQQFKHRGGFNIYPRDVEEAVYGFPKTAEAAVIGVPDALMGEAVVAFVVLKPGQTATAEEVIAFCETRLARYKCPKEVRFVETLPKSPIGKILRKELRSQIGNQP